MNHEQVAMQVADVIAAEPAGTKVVVWADGSVTRSCSAANPTVMPGTSCRPIAFFVAGIDRPHVPDIAIRVRRAHRDELRPAS